METYWLVIAMPFGRLRRSFAALTSLAAIILFPMTARCSDFAFEEIAPPTSENRRAIVTSKRVTLPSGREHPIAFKIIAESGIEIGGTRFGQLYNRDGKPIAFHGGGGAAISHKLDHSSLLSSGGKLYSISHFEHGPGALYLSALEQNRDGQLKAVSTRNIGEIKSVDGIWYPCAGVVTAWGTHLAGEEFPPDARRHEVALRTRKSNYHPLYVVPAFRYFFDVDLTSRNPEVDIDILEKNFNPYRYGFVFEAKVETGGTSKPRVELKKHYAMGRFSHEVAFVMPDDRTVYMTDDASNAGGFFMFVADRARDFSTGELFGARWEQTTPKRQDETGGADITWVSLGHSSAEDLTRIKEKIARAPATGTLFGELFDTAVPDKTNRCPKSFGATNFGGTGKGECLRVKSREMEIVASRLETRRYAALKGATTEFSKSEGLAFDPIDNRLFMAIAQIKGGMTEERGKWRPETEFGSNQEHIRLSRNKCGAVFALDISPDQNMRSDYVVTNMYELIRGEEGTGWSWNDLFANRCDVDKISGPDNLTFMPEYRTLIISEDTDFHQNNAVWAYNVSTQKLTRIQTMPEGAEATSVFYHPNINGYGYLISAAQHPDLSAKTNGETRAGDYAGVRAAYGYIGPFPASSTANQKPVEGAGGE